MSCFAEIKYNGDWRYAGEIFIKRNRVLFAKMCADILSIPGLKSISPEKGWPLDMDDLTKAIVKKHYENDYCHSYLTDSEVGELYDWFLEPEEDSSREDLREDLFKVFPFSLDKNSRPEEVEEVRLIFSFNS
jgi:hypothetical protein